MRFAVVGAGGVGGYYGARLAQAGHDVTYIARGDHLRATVSAPQFEGLSRIDQHRLVKAAVKERFDDGTIHALSVKTEAAE